MTGDRASVALVADAGESSTQRGGLGAHCRAQAQASSSVSAVRCRGSANICRVYATTCKNAPRGKGAHLLSLGAALPPPRPSSGHPSR